MAAEIIKDASLWDEFVDSSPYGTLFHKWNSLKIIERHAGFQLKTFGVYKGEKLLGLFPLYYKKSRGVKMLFSPPPRTGIYYLGFVLSNEYDSQKQSKKEGDLGYFSDEMEKSIEEMAADYMLVNTVPGFLDMRFFRWNNYSVEPNYTYAIDLCRPLEEVWNGFHKYLRRDIKNAENTGLAFGPADDISTFYSMQSRRYKEQGMSDPLISENYLKDLYRAYPDNIKMYHVHDKNGEIISATATQEYKDRSRGWMGLMKTVGHGNEFLVWNLIQLAKQKGFKKFEIIGANVKNQCPFKSKFNPGLETNYIISKRNNRGRLAEWAYVNFVKNNKLNKS